MPLDAVLELRYRASTERLLAVARLLTTSVLFLAIASSMGLLHPEPAKYLMVAYVAYAAGVLVVLRNSVVRARAGSLLHVVDMVWATAATSLSGGPSSHLAPLFAFVLVGAAFRWGLRRTLFESAIVIAILASQSALALVGLMPWPFESDWLFVWVFYSVVLAALFGLLSERMHALSFQAAALGQVMARVGQSSGLFAAIRATLSEVSRLFGAARALLVLEDASTKELFLYRAETLNEVVRVWGGPAATKDRETRLFALPGEVAGFEVVRPSAPGAPPVVSLALDQAGVASRARFSVPPAFLDPFEWNVVIGAAVDVGRGWKGRLYLADPGVKPGGHVRLGFLLNLARQVTPVILDLYLLRGLRSRAELHERARISRELHDGVIQSLAAIEMRLQESVRQAESLSPDLAADLDVSRALLHEEAIRTRELMVRLRPLEVDARRFENQLRDLVQRFSRATGIDVRLEWAAGPLELSPHACGEIAHVVQESLVNARRHSGASRVLVRFEADEDTCRLTVEDNGRGFGFTGQLSDDRLGDHPGMPRVIAERVTAIGGLLTLSSSSEGARLQIDFPPSVEHV